MHILLQGQHTGKQGVGLPLSGLAVLDAPQHSRRAQNRASILEVLPRHPASRQDAVVERQGFIATNKGRGIDEAQKLLAGLRMYPEIHTDQVLALDRATGFFKGFAHHGLLRGLAGLDMAAGLTEYTSSHGAFFNEQVFVVVLDYRSNCQVGWIHSF